MIGKWCIIDCDEEGEFCTGQVIEQIGETHFLINMWTKEHPHQRLVPISALDWGTHSTFFNTAADMENFVKWIYETTKGPKVVNLEKK